MTERKRPATIRMPSRALRTTEEANARMEERIRQLEAMVRVLHGVLAACLAPLHEWSGGDTPESTAAEAAMAQARALVPPRVVPEAKP